MLRRDREAQPALLAVLVAATVLGAVAAGRLVIWAAGARLQRALHHEKRNDPS